ncbi:unnamed protein product [Polarella glacialis]|uniref:Uncharacterized protein n=1 Tax=Polarella glacialis TaxID=89957 RepID=A0A813LND1_POLGL|nr:unnamed protein product [Polarella glacialis]
MTNCQVFVEQQHCTSLTENCDECLEAARQDFQASATAEEETRDSGVVRLVHDTFRLKLNSILLNSHEKKQMLASWKFKVLQAQRQSEWAGAKREKEEENNLAEVKEVHEAKQTEATNWKLLSAKRLKQLWTGARKHREARRKTMQDLVLARKAMLEARRELRAAYAADDSQAISHTKTIINRIRAMIRILYHRMDRQKEASQRSVLVLEEIHEDSYWLSKNLGQKADMVKQEVDQQELVFRRAQLSENSETRDMKAARDKLVDVKDAITKLKDMAKDIKQKMKDHPITTYIPFALRTTSTEAPDDGQSS